ncbi:MAG: hypothetical protein AAF331_10130 [Pseudomonadota bacterium]
MRLILFIALLAAAGFAGWIAGSLHPAPSSILNPIKQRLAVERPLIDDPGPTTERVEQVESQPTASLPSAAARDAQYRAWISQARLEHPYPENEDKMYAVMMCESGGRADVVNPAGPYSGLFQYVEGTWSGDWNAYRDSDIFDARAQIFATALAWNQNMQSHWGCYSRAH